MDINGNAALRYEDRGMCGWLDSGTRNSTNRDEGGTPSNAIKLGGQRQLSPGCDSIAVLFMGPWIFWAVVV